METKKVIIICAGGEHALTEKMRADLTDKFGKDGFVCVDPKNARQHITQTRWPAFENPPIPIINYREDLPALKLYEEPTRPMDAILKHKKYK